MHDADMRDVSHASDRPAELLERGVAFDVLCESLESVRRSRKGRVVLVGGEAGVGKTALLRWFCRERGGVAPILSGGCDALFTPRPLGPLLAVARKPAARSRKRSRAARCRTSLLRRWFGS